MPGERPVWTCRVTPLSRRPGDIADTAVFLASPGARHITGQAIHVNGGVFTTR